MVIKDLFLKFEMRNWLIKLIYFIIHELDSDDYLGWKVINTTFFDLFILISLIDWHEMMNLKRTSRQLIQIFQCLIRLVIIVRFIVILINIFLRTYLKTIKEHFFFKDLTISELIKLESLFLSERNLLNVWIKIKFLSFLKRVNYIWG